MYFIGREEETRKIIRSLERGNNVVLVGKYGIGKTSLIRHVESLTRDRWQFAFADFSQMPGDIARALWSQLSRDREKKRSRRDRITAKSGRYRLTQLEAGDRTRIIVLDNIAKLTHPKLRLIRYIGWDRKFRFVAVVESFLPEEELLRIRAELLPSDTIRLSYLSRRSTGEFLRYFSEKHDFRWTEDQINYLVSMTRGYSLGMKECVDARLQSARNREGIPIERE